MDVPIPRTIAEVIALDREARSIAAGLLPERVA
jgi:hypothetical protein